MLERIVVSDRTGADRDGSRPRGSVAKPQMRLRRRLARYAPPVRLPPRQRVVYATRQVVLRAAERVLGRPAREETLTWSELTASGRLNIGRYSYGRPTVYAYPGDQGRIAIGSFVSIAHGVEIFLGGNHRADWLSTYPFRIVFDLPGAYEDGLPATKGEVTIGNDVWIGKGTKILSGVHIGDGAVLGGYSVITRDVRPYAVVAGNPAREVRRRFRDDEVEVLERIAWWDWPIENIIEAIPLLCSEDVEGLDIRSKHFE